MSGTSDDFERFGPYVIVRTLGSGGMGRVQLALRGEGVGQVELCIIKRMHADERAPDQDARFEREARIAARLSHENIARTLRVESVEGELCLIQEFIEGMNLSRLMRQAGAQAAPEWAAAHIVREVANALAYAHEFGEMDIVHRDVTPENVMLSYPGEVKLIDFGISRSRVDGTLTSLGAVVGRRAYMSPEVWAGMKPDRRADVFALGVVLWELVTARRLEETDEVTWSDVIPDPRTLRPEMRADLAAVVLRAVAPDPAVRFQTAGEFRAALAPFIDPTKDLRRELATLLAFYFNVDRNREVLAEQVEEAKAALLGPSLASGRRAARRRGIWVAAATAGLVVVSGVAISGVVRRTAVSRPEAPRIRESVATNVVPPMPVPSEPLPPPAPPAPPAAPRVERGSPSEIKAHPVVGSKEKEAVNPPPRQEPASVLLRKASEEFDDGRLTDAMSLARKAASTGGGAQAHALLGYIYMSQGQLAGAERELTQAVRMNPGDPEAVKRLGDVKRALSERGE